MLPLKQFPASVNRDRVTAVYAVVIGQTISSQTFDWVALNFLFTLPVGEIDK